MLCKSINLSYEALVGSISSKLRLEDIMGDIPGADTVTQLPIRWPLSRSDGCRQKAEPGS